MTLLGVVLIGAMGHLEERGRTEVQRFEGEWRTGFGAEKAFCWSSSPWAPIGS